MIPRGFFIESDKSHFVQAPGVSEEVSREDTDPLECRHEGGGGGSDRVFVGSYESK